MLKGNPKKEPQWRLWVSYKLWYVIITHILEHSVLYSSPLRMKGVIFSSCLVLNRDRRRKKGKSKRVLLRNLDGGIHNRKKTPNTI